MLHDPNTWHTIPDYQLLVANFGSGANRRVTIIRSSHAHIDEPWVAIPGTNIILLGRAAPAELRRYLAQTPTTQVRLAFPGRLSGHTNDTLRAHYGLTQPRLPR